MGKYMWGWAQVRSGQVINFRYNGVQRIVIVMSCPKDPGAKDKHLMHAIQLQSAGRGVSGIGAKLPRILDKMGGVVLLLDDIQKGKFFKIRVGYDSEFDQIRPDTAYASLKGLIARKDLYKTFNWEKCRKSSLFLDNDELNEFNIPINMLSDTGVIQSEELPPVKPNPKTFKRKPRRQRYNPGMVWQRRSGVWAGKNLDGKIETFDTEKQAKIWAATTNDKWKQMIQTKAEKMTKKQLAKMNRRLKDKVSRWHEQSGMKLKKSMSKKNDDWK